ncbi:MAG: hypothetical protein KKC99_13170, partial [Proteobacteria bacterium]|nr:hypothetical protein [Pseudomonadota bacterium]
LLNDRLLALDQRLQPCDAFLERTHASAEITSCDPCRSPVNGYEFPVKRWLTMKKQPGGDVQ